MELQELMLDPNFPQAVGVGRVGVLLEEKSSREYAGGLVSFSQDEPIRRGEIVLIGEADGIFPMAKNIQIGAVCSAISWTGKQIVKLTNGRELAIVYHAELTLFF